MHDVVSSLKELLEKYPHFKLWVTPDCPFQVRLDGFFTADDLRRIADAMELTGEKAEDWNTRLSAFKASLAGKTFEELVSLLESLKATSSGMYLELRTKWVKEELRDRVNKVMDWEELTKQPTASR